MRVFGSPNALFTELEKRNLKGVSVGHYTPSGQVAFPGTGSHGLILTSSSQATLDYPGSNSTVLSGFEFCAARELHKLPRCALFLFPDGNRPD
jgi:hypothetical protein